MEIEYRTMSDLFAGALYQGFAFLVHQLRSAHDDTWAFLPHFYLIDNVCMQEAMHLEKINGQGWTVQKIITRNAKYI